MCLDGEPLERERGDATHDARHTRARAVVMLPVRDGGDAKRRKTHDDDADDGGHGKGAARVDVPPPPPGGGMGAQSTATARDTESWRVSGHDAGQRRERFGAGTSGTISLAVMDRAQREKAKSETKLLEEKEHEFHLKQTKVRADIRIKEGRAKAIDLIARNVFAESYVEFDAFVNPLTVLSGLTLSDMEELKKDLEDVRDLDTKHARRREFWLAMIGVTLEAIKEARAKEEAERARIRGQTTEREEGTSLHTDIDDDVVEIVSGKSSAELAELESEITAQIQGPDASEVEYWSEVLKRISTAKTKANVEEMHSALKVKFEREEIEDAGRKRAAFLSAAAKEDADEDLLGADFGKHMADDDVHASEWDDDERISTPARAPSLSAAYDPTLSPKTIRIDELEDGIEIIDAAKDAAEITRLREEERIKGMSRFKKVTSATGVLRGKTEEDVYNAFKTAGGAHHSRGVLGNLITGTTDFKEIEKQEDAKAKAMVERMMGATEDGDANFSAEVTLESQAYWWHDKYRPRKPKYFNRVHTGYVWNKYNQMHYDSSNPPPKVVQGYKFNIFYPDLIDKAKAPSYTVVPDGSPDNETVLLKISAGPPYEDIAFKIVNKEWEYSHKRGFRCTFERGIFHLYINFKRSKYRR